MVLDDKGFTEKEIQDCINQKSYMREYEKNMWKWKANLMMMEMICNVLTEKPIEKSLKGMKKGKKK